MAVSAGTIARPETPSSPRKTLRPRCSVRRQIKRLSKNSPASTIAGLDVFLMHMLAYRNAPLRASDLAFALAIDDMHLVSYSLKKLTKLGFTANAKSGKEVVYRATPAAVDHRNGFLEDRARYVEPVIQDLVLSGMDVKALTRALRALSGVYEQAARAAACEKGID